MENLVTILKEAIPGITAEDLLVPIYESGIHSLDSVIIRGTLESHFGFEIPDNVWYTFGTLKETLSWCNERKLELTHPDFKEAKVRSHRSHEIHLPQMANGALSENWLLKEMGDMHWDLLSKGLGQKTTDFSDKQGNRVYAAFVRISYSLSPLNLFRENEILNLNGAIKRHGNHHYFSSINESFGGKFIEANLMTSFSARKSNDNVTFAAGRIECNENQIDEIEAAPEFYTQYRQLSKGKIQEISSGGYTFKITDAAIDSCLYNINPYYDINGAGLLYFAAYPIVADFCASGFFRHTMKMMNYDREYHTIFRDIFYFANCNADDRLIVKLNSAEILDENKLQLTTSILRESDGKLIARILTVKQKVGM